MGNYRFRLSDMIPNSWFYKLRDMGTTRNRKFRHLPSSSSPPFSNTNTTTTSTSSFSSKLPLQPSFLQTTLSHHHRKSYYFNGSNSPPPSQPRKSFSSSRRRRSLKRRQAVSTTSSISCRASLKSVWNNPNDSDNDSVTPECGSDDDEDSSSCKPLNDIVIEIDDTTPRLPPIITKKVQVQVQEQEDVEAAKIQPVKVVKEVAAGGEKRSSVSGVRLRTNSPRIMNRRGAAAARKSTSSSSLAVVKSSRNPRRDFRESMVEMIMENNIRGSKDLEELLACYLSLNSDEYHDMIINVFKQIWFDFMPIHHN